MKEGRDYDGGTHSSLLDIDPDWKLTVSNTKVALLILLAIVLFALLFSENYVVYE